MLQVRWSGTPSQEMYRYKPEMPALQGARNTVGAQDEGTGMRSSANQPRTNREPAVPSGVKEGSPPQGTPTLSPRARRLTRSTRWKR